MSGPGLAQLLSSRATATAPYRGRAAAAGYGDLAEEWRAADSGAGVADFSFLTDIIATGGERTEFLQGQLSQDVSELEVGSGLPALALSAQGRIQAVLALYARGESIDLVVDATGCDAARARLEQFLVADDVEFEGAPERDRIGLVGPRAGELLAEVAGVPVAPGSWWTRELEIAGIAVTARARGDLRVPCVDLVVDGDGTTPWLALEALGAVPLGSAALEILRVESGLPLLGIDIDDTRIAVEARLEWAIHFNKGCYVGQEVVERAVSRGRINRELCLLGTERPVLPGARLAGGTERDCVTSAAQSPRSGPLCLAYVPTALAEPGAALTLDLDCGAAVAARVLDWPRRRRLEGR